MKIVDTLMEYPELEFIRQELNQRMEEEHKRRLQFYQDVRENQKAEFINGEVIIHSPVKFKHSSVAERIHHLLVKHVKLYRLGVTGFDKLMVSLTRNDYEPDICYFSTQRAANFEDDTMFFPAPDFVVEVLSKSTAHRDRGIKFRDYAKHGVSEYWIVSPSKKNIEQYKLYEGEYQLICKWVHGVVESFAIPGFQVEVQAAFDEEYFAQLIEKDKREIIRLSKSVAEKDNALAEKDNALAEKDNALAEKDNALAEKDRLIEELKRQLQK